MKILSGKMAAVLAAAASFVCAGPLAAEESGSFEMLTSYVHGYTTVEYAGQTVRGGPLDGTGTIIETSGGPFAEDMNYRIGCVVYLKKSEAGLDLEAPCVFTDGEGDSWYAVSKRSAGDVEVGGGGQGSQEIEGGTGRYAGVTGTCRYTNSYLPDGWVVARRSCEWRKP